MMNADQLFQFLQKVPLDERGTFNIQCGCDDGQILTEVKYACSLQEAIGKSFGLCSIPELLEGGV